MDDLLGIPAGGDLSASRAKAAELLPELETRVSTSVALGTSMPREVVAAAPLTDVMDRATWIYSEALHAAILRFNPEEDESDDLRDGQAVVDALLTGALVNTDPRLLSACKDMDPDGVPAYSQPGSPWPAVMRAREAELLPRLERMSWKPDSLAEAATWALDDSIARWERCWAWLRGMRGVRVTSSARRWLTTPR